jgi:hypothetical protein
MVIGADEDIRPTRNRGQFYRFIPAAVGEISIRDTLHEDAQYPSQHTLRAFEDDPDDTEEAQITFVSALTASAFSLAATGSIDYAWNSFENGLKKGIFFNARRGDCHGFSQIVSARTKGRGSALGRSDRHRGAGAWAGRRLAAGTR